VTNITSPANGSLAAGPVVTISGTATDRGGAVGGVEVSTDGGQTWHPAVGTDRWTYEWQVPPGSGSATIMSRASDDTLNLETPKRGIAVKHGRPTTQAGPAGQ
jgi:hypothetical protein